MRVSGVNRLVFSSTAAVYGEPRRVPIAEADRTEPINPYGDTKLAFEGAMRWFCRSHDFRAISLRYFNVAGATERNGEDHEPGDPPHAARPERRRRRGDPRPDLRPGLPDARMGPASATSSTSATWPPRTCLALEATGEGDSSIEVYNLGSAAGFSVREVVEAARKVTGRAIPAARREAPHRRSAGARRLVASRAPRSGLASGALQARADAGRRLGLASHPPDGYAEGPRQRGAVVDRHRRLVRARVGAQIRRPGAPIIELSPAVVRSRPRTTLGVPP